MAFSPFISYMFRRLIRICWIGSNSCMQYLTQTNCKCDFVIHSLIFRIHYFLPLELHVASTTRRQLGSGAGQRAVGWTHRYADQEGNVIISKLCSAFNLLRVLVYLALLRSSKPRSTKRSRVAYHALAYPYKLDVFQGGNTTVTIT